MVALCLYIKHDVGAEAHCSNDGIVCVAILMWMDALTWKVLIDEAVVRGEVGRMAQDVVMTGLSFER